MVGWVKCGRKRWRIVGVYMEKNGIEGTLRNLEKWIGNKDGSVKTIVGTLILEQGEREREGGESQMGWRTTVIERRTNSKNGKLNTEDRILLNFIE